MQMSQMKIETYAVPVFDQDMVVPADGNKEKNDLHVVKDVNPLLPLGPLSTDIEHAVREIAQLEYCFCDAGCS